MRDALARVAFAIGLILYTSAPGRPARRRKVSESRLHSEITQLPVVDPHSAASAPPQEGQPLLEPSAPGFETIGRDLVRRREHKHASVRSC